MSLELNRLRRNLRENDDRLSELCKAAPTINSATELFQRRHHAILEHLDRIGFAQFVHDLTRPDCSCASSHTDGA